MRAVSFPALGTTAALLVTDEGQVARAEAILRAEVDAVDRACSRFRTDSELAAVNTAAGRRTEVTDLFVEALRTALRAARVSDGLVDPTIGSALRVLGYDRDFAGVDRTGPALTVSVGRVPGWQAVELDETRRAVRVPPGVELDLGATAKALCADRAARAVHDATCAGVLVSLGGDVSVRGPAPAAGWPVHVTDDHAAPPAGAGQRIAIRSGGLATSGTTVRRWERGAAVLHHLIDPRTGRPADQHWRTVSAVAASCVDANIATTAAIVLGAAATDWLSVRRIPARLVAADGTVTRTAGWPAEVVVAC